MALALPLPCLSQMREARKMKRVVVGLEGSETRAPCTAADQSTVSAACARVAVRTARTQPVHAQHAAAPLIGSSLRLDMYASHVDMDMDMSTDMSNVSCCRPGA